MIFNIFWRTAALNRYIQMTLFNNLVFPQTNDGPCINKEIIIETRKSKTEAVLQRRSMLKLGVICKLMKRYGKCFLS